MAHISSLLVSSPNHSARLFNPCFVPLVALDPFYAEAELEVVVRTP